MTKIKTPGKKAETGLMELEGFDVGKKLDGLFALVVCHKITIFAE